MDVLNPEDLEPWDLFGLRIAYAAQKKSKDRSTQVGAALMSPDHTTIIPGYNGFPARIVDDPAVLSKEMGYAIPADWKELTNLTDAHWIDPVVSLTPFQESDITKNDLIIHAEQNCILHCPQRPIGWTLYCTHIPCSDRCSPLIVAAGIDRVVCVAAKGNSDMGYDKTATILRLGNVTITLVRDFPLKYR